MKKLLFCFAMFALALAGCNDKVTINYEYPVDYIYVNDSSSDITVHSFLLHNGIGVGVVDTLFVVPVKETFNFRTWKTAPLVWWGTVHNEDYTTISNGETTVTQTRGNRDAIYEIKNYIVHSKDWKNKIYIFLFQDSFFENREPIEE